MMLNIFKHAGLAVSLFSGVLNAFNLSSSKGGTTCQSPAGTVLVPHKPAIISNSTAYVVKVRPSGDAHAPWLTVPLWNPHIMQINSTTGSGELYQASLGYFDFDGSVDVSIVPDATLFPSLTNIALRPVSYGINAAVNNRTITFTIAQPHNNLVVDIGGNVLAALHLWTNTIEKNPITAAQAAANNSKIIYYGPGYHNAIPGNVINLSSGETLYIDAGAVVHAGVNILNSTDVAIRGHGIFYGETSGFQINYSQNVVVQDVSCINSNNVNIGQSKGVRISNYRTITGQQYGDGIDSYCSQDVLIEKVFVRTSDDCIALYQHRNDFYGDSKNITIRDSSLWADVAHPFTVGTHGNTPNPETMTGVTFSNIDILDHREPQVDYEGCIGFMVGDGNLIQDIHISDVRVENFRWGMLLSLRVMFNPKYNTSPGRGIKNITIANLSYTGSGPNVNTVVIDGYSTDRSIDFLDFQNLTINGLHVWDGMTKPRWYKTADMWPAIIGSNVNNLTFSS